MSKEIGGLKLYNLKELSNLMGLSLTSLRTYLREGKLKGRKFGREWYVTEENLKDYFTNSPDDDSNNKKVPINKN